MSFLNLWGQARTSGNPLLWQTAAVSSDGGTAIVPSAQSNHIAPAGFGGECLFAYAHLTLTWSMAAQLRVTPIIDGVSAPVTVTAGTVAVVQPILTLAQQAGTPLQRVTQTFAVPLMRRLLDQNSAEISRWFARGSRCALLIESIGALGSGELILDGCELEFDVVRKSIYNPVSA